MNCRDFSSRALRAATAYEKMTLVELVMEVEIVGRITQAKSDEEGMRKIP